MRLTHVPAQSAAWDGRSGFERALGRLRLRLAAVGGDALLVPDETTAQRVRTATGGAGAPVLVARDAELPECVAGPSVLILATDARTMGGGMRYTCDWANSLLELGHRTRLVPLWKGGTVNSRRVGRAAATLFAARALLAALRLRPEAIVATHPGLAPVAAALSRIMRAPFAVCLLGTDAWGGFGRVHARALKAATLIVPISYFTRDIAAGRLGLGPEAFYVSGVPISPAFERVATTRSPSGDRRKLLLTVARLDDDSPYKRHNLVIEAVAELAPSYPDLRYDIVGDGPYRAELEALAGRLGVADRVIFRGRLDQGELTKSYRAAYAFVMPSRVSLDPPEGEGFGIVYLEAGAFGVPSVAAAAGGAAEAVLDGFTGILVEPDSLESLVAGLRKLLDDPRLRDELGEGARRRALEFGHAQFRKRCGAVLEHLAARGDCHALAPEHARAWTPGDPGRAKE